MTPRQWLCSSILTLLFCGCSMDVHKNAEGKEKNVAINTPFGNLNVNTEKVTAQDTGISIYPGATAKPEDSHDKENKANVNINTPWMAVKVVALSYLSDDAPDKIWDYYKKDLSKYGHVLECKPGSPDMDLKKSGKDDLTCNDHGKSHVQLDEIKTGDQALKVGTESRQRIVAVRPHGSGSEFNLVYVAVHQGKDGGS